MKLVDKILVNPLVERYWMEANPPVFSFDLAQKDTFTVEISRNTIQLFKIVDVDSKNDVNIFHFDYKRLKYLAETPFLLKRYPLCEQTKLVLSKRWD